MQRHHITEIGAMYQTIKATHDGYLRDEMIDALDDYFNIKD